MKRPRVTERIVRDAVRQCRNRFVGPTIGGDTFAIAIRGEPRAYYVICAGRNPCTCAQGDAQSERQSEIRAAWVEDERRKIYTAAQKKGALL